MTSKEDFKTVLVGESNVGKTCIISQFVLNKFDSESQPSNTAQFNSKEIKLADNTSITLQIWDIAGQTKYRAVSKIFTKDAKALILIYDVTNENSFKELKDFWHANNKNYGAKFFVVANKCDLEDKKVKDEEGKAFAESIGADFFSISAKNNIGLSQLFERIGEVLKK